MYMLESRVGSGDLRSVQIMTELLIIASSQPMLPVLLGVFLLLPGTGAVTHGKKAPSAV